MERESVKRMTLTGELPGVAVITERASFPETEIRLRLRKKPSGLILLSGGEGRVVWTNVPEDGTPVVLPRGKTELLALAKDGRIAAAGSFGRIPSRLMDEIRIIASGLIMDGLKDGKPSSDGEREKPEKKEPAPKDGETPAPAPKAISRGRAPMGPPLARATRGILEQAERLFGMLDSMMGSDIPENRAKRDDSPRSEPEKTTPVRNPFPRTFPDSVWKRRDGEGTLYGSVLKNGRVTELVAVPVPRGSARPERAMGFTPMKRPVRAMDGANYWVFVKDREPMN